jgi:Arc/MetJ-type ribon-helix-helix transcriptional regulator
MTIQLKPDTERLVQDELQSGRFHSIDEMIVEGVRARRSGQKKPSAEAAQAAIRIRNRRSGIRLPEGVTIRDLIDEGRC